MSTCRVSTDVKWDVEYLTGKLVDALVQPVVYKLDTYVNNIETSKSKMLEFRDAAHIAQQADMKFTLENTSAGTRSLVSSVQLLHPNFKKSVFNF